MYIIYDHLSGVTLLLLLLLQLLLNESWKPSSGIRTRIYHTVLLKVKDTKLLPETQVNGGKIQSETGCLEFNFKLSLNNHFKHRLIQDQSYPVS